MNIKKANMNVKPCPIEGCGKLMFGDGDFCSNECRKKFYESKRPTCFRVGCGKKCRVKKGKYCSVSCRRLDMGLSGEVPVCKLDGCDKLCNSGRIEFCTLAHKEMFDSGIKLADTFPLWTCDVCNVRIRLPFDPIDNMHKWRNFLCPTCYPPEKLSTGNTIDKSLN